MRRCTGGACSFCSRGIGSQWRHAFGVYDLGIRAVGVVELGASAAGDLRACAEEMGGLRGLGVRFYRDGEGVRSRIRVEPCMECHRDPGDLPECPDVVAILRAFWARQG